MMVEKEVYKVLEDLSVDFKIYRHPPVFTVDEAERYWENIPSTHCKNLFFRNKKGSRHFLVILRHDKQLDIRKLGELIGGGRLSFASERRLFKYLGLAPGSVSPFGLINDNDNHVEVFIDNDLKQADYLGFHPNDNSITITLSIQDFIKYLNWSKNQFSFFRV